MKKVFSGGLAVFIFFVSAMFVLLHSTPSLALRTYVFSIGHPIAALTTNIKDDSWHNKEDEKRLKKEHGHCYTLTKPPIEKRRKVI